MYKGIGIHVEKDYFKVAKQLLSCFGMSDVVAFSGGKCGEWLSKNELIDCGTLYGKQGFSHPSILASAENSYYEKSLRNTVNAILGGVNPDRSLEMYCVDNLYHVAKALFGSVIIYSVYDYGILGYRREKVYSSAEEMILLPL